MASEIAAIDAASSNSSEQGDSKAASAPAPNPLYRQRRWLPAARRSSRSSTVSYLPTPKRPGETSSFPILSFSLMFFSCFCRGHLRHHQRWPQHCGKQESPQLPPVSCFSAMWCLQVANPTSCCRARSGDSTRPPTLSSTSPTRGSILQRLASCTINSDLFILGTDSHQISCFLVICKNKIKPNALQPNNKPTRYYSIPECSV